MGKRVSQNRYNLVLARSKKAAILLFQKNKSFLLVLILFSRIASPTGTAKGSVHVHFGMATW